MHSKRCFFSQPMVWAPKSPCPMAARKEVTFSARSGHLRWKWPMGFGKLDGVPLSFQPPCWTPILHHSMPGKVYEKKHLHPSSGRGFWLEHSKNDQQTMSYNLNIYELLIFWMKKESFIASLELTYPSSQGSFWVNDVFSLSSCVDILRFPGRYIYNINHQFQTAFVATS